MLILMLFLPLNDVTTTYPDVPQFKTISGHRSDVNYAYQNDNFEKQKRLHPDIAPLKAHINPAETFKLVEQVVRGEGWDIIDVDLKNMRIEAVCTTTLLRFKDDVVIEVRAADSSVHMRSKSRVGRGDLGTNAKRIQSFFTKLRSKF